MHAAGESEWKSMGGGPVVYEYLALQDWGATTSGWSFGFVTLVLSLPNSFFIVVSVGRKTGEGYAQHVGD